MTTNPLLLLCVARLVLSEKMEGFIVGGKPAEIEYFGHSAFLTVEIAGTVFVCGGSILNQNVILTAAHCFEGFSRRSKVSMRAGNVSKLRGALRYAARVAVHMDYDPYTINNDIALGFTRRPFEFNSFIRRVIIMKDPPRTSEGYVAGWGLVDEQRNLESDLLYRAKQTLVSRDECKNLLKQVPTGIICGGVRQAREYAAEGDSGSALVIEGGIQVGLVSFKRPEISLNIVVYTDVAYFYNWIKSTAEKLYCVQRDDFY